MKPETSSPSLDPKKVCWLEIIILMQQVEIKSALNFKDLFYEIIFLEAQKQFKIINSDICYWWIEIYL